MPNIKKGRAPGRTEARFVRQRESYPKLDLVATKAAMDRLEPAVCVFERARGQVGQLFVPIVEDNFIVVNYIFAIEHIGHVEDEVILRTRPSPTELDKQRRLFECPTCGSNRWSLYFCATWACASCLGLSYRSQLIDKTITLTEGYESLRARVGRGRPKGMHNGTYNRLLEELAVFEKKLEGRPRKQASEEHDLIISERWVAGAGIDLWSSRYTVRAGQLVRVTS